MKKRAKPAPLPNRRRHERKSSFVPKFHLGTPSDPREILFRARFNPYRVGGLLKQTQGRFFEPTLGYIIQPLQG